MATVKFAGQLMVVLTSLGETYRKGPFANEKAAKAFIVADKDDALCDLLDDTPPRRRYKIVSATAADLKAEAKRLKDERQQFADLKRICRSPRLLAALRRRAGNPD